MISCYDEDVAYSTAYEILEEESDRAAKSRFLPTDKEESISSLAEDFEIKGEDSSARTYVFVSLYDVNLKSEFANIVGLNGSMGKLHKLVKEIQTICSGVVSNGQGGKN